MEHYVDNIKSFPLVQSLFSFICKNKHKKFITGDWVETLSDLELTSLKGYIHSITDVSFAIVIFAYATETETFKSELETKHLMTMHDVLYLMVIIEELRRKGNIELSNTFSIQPDTLIECKLTNKGEQVFNVETGEFIL